MKRNIILAGVFSLLFALLMLTSCTCYQSDGELRGCGYYCKATCSDCESCGMSCLDSLCPGEDIWEDYEKTISIVGQLGVDYREPAISHIDYGSEKVCVRIETLTDYGWEIQGEILLFQGNTVVGTAEFRGVFGEAGVHEIQKTYTLNIFYSSENGEVVGVINNYSVTRIDR